jgi:hypothetical protein
MRGEKKAEEGQKAVGRKQKAEGGRSRMKNLKVPPGG